MQDIEDLYDRHVAAGTAISAHLPRLRALAEGLPLAVEFGVKRGASSCALLLGAKRVISYDIAPTREAMELKRIVPEWDYRIEDSRAATFEDPDLLFIDSLHTYAQCRDELAAHGHRVKRFLVFHDITTFGEVGAEGESGRQSWTYQAGKGSVPEEHLGLRPAIDELMIADPSWRIVARYNDSHGLLVLERR